MDDLATTEDNNIIAAAIDSHVKTTNERQAILTADIHTFRIQQQIETVLHLKRICETEYRTALFIVSDSAFWPDNTIKFEPPPRIVTQDWQADMTEDSIAAHDDDDKDDDPMDDCSYDDGFWEDDEHLDEDYAYKVFCYQSLMKSPNKSIPMHDDQQNAITLPESQEGSKNPGKTTHWHTHSPSESTPEPKTLADITTTTTPNSHFTLWNIPA
jgi:hypothetical protein